MINDLDLLYVYMIVSGIIVGIVFCSIMIYWIRKTQYEIKLLRIGL